MKKDEFTIFLGSLALLFMLAGIFTVVKKGKELSSQSQNAAGLQAAQQKREAERIEILRAPATLEQNPVAKEIGTVMESHGTSVPGIYQIVWRRDDGFLLGDLSPRDFVHGTPVIRMRLVYYHGPIIHDGESIFLLPLDPRSEDYRKLTVSTGEKQ